MRVNLPAMRPVPATRRIQRLSTQLANQIAAGEVVERPASVVKELLENSLDAGARCIDVDVENGGSQLIRVRDDGCGIHPEDLALGLSRHATSKIVSPEELDRIASLGFRGEALASIASVSRLTLTSRIAGQASAWTVQADGGVSDPQPQSAAYATGTTLEVRDLFYNTPARRRFLRTERTEFAHVEEVVRRIALSRFDVAVSLRHNRRQVLRLSQVLERDGEEQRVARTCGTGFMEHALALEFEVDGLRLWGWLGEPGYTRSQADQQHFYVNGRIVRDKLVTHAVRQAYRDRLYPGRHPAYVLYLELDPCGVDVNVHPTKHEVRFREARRVHDFLFRSLHTALEDDSVGVTEVAVPRYGIPKSMAGRDAPPRSAAPPPGQGVETAAWAEFRGTLGGRYILAENAEGLLVVDIPAARREIAGQRLAEAAAEGSVPSRPLLVPAALSVGEAEAAGAEQNAETLHRLGFDVGRAGPATLLIRAAPVLLGPGTPESTLRRVLPRLRASAPDLEELRTLVAEEVAHCPAPTTDEARALLRALQTLGEGARHRVIARLRYEELARYFQP